MSKKITKQKIFNPLIKWLDGFYDTVENTSLFQEDDELVEIKEEQPCELDELRERIRSMEREILNLKKKLLEVKSPRRVRRSTLI